MLFLLSSELTHVLTLLFGSCICMIYLVDSIMSFVICADTFRVSLMLSRKQSKEVVVRVEVVVTVSAALHMI